MQLSHFIIPKILVLEKTFIDPPVTANTHIPHLIGANRSHGREAPYPPSLCDSLPNLRMANRQTLMENSIDQDDDPRPKA